MKMAAQIDENQYKRWDVRPSSSASSSLSSSSSSLALLKIFSKAHTHRKLHPYLQLQHEFSRYEQSDHDHASGMITAAL